MMHARLEQLPGCQRPPEHLPVRAILQRRFKAVQRRARDAPRDALTPCETSVISLSAAGESRNIRPAGAPFLKGCTCCPAPQQNAYLNTWS